MKIAVFGTGTVGRTIGGKLISLGHEVFLGTRNTASTLSNQEKDKFGNPPYAEWQKDHPEINLMTFEEATLQSDRLIFNCTSGLVSIAALDAAGANSLAGKILVDIANPLDFSQGMPPFLNPVNTDSLGEQIQRKFPDLKVVKSLNTMTAKVMVDPTIVKGDHTVFISGNDQEAKSQVKEILIAFGWAEKNIIDLGDITTARGAEMLLPIWLRLWNVFGTAEFNFHIKNN